jgi:hypothetical protein
VLVLKRICEAVVIDCRLLLIPGVVGGASVEHYVRERQLSTPLTVEEPTISFLKGHLLPVIIVYVTVWELSPGEDDPLSVVVADVWRVTALGNRAQGELTLIGSW